MGLRKEPFPQFQSPDGEIYTCIFFATKTPPGIEWFGFRVESREKNDVTYFGVVDLNRWEYAYFTLKDLKKIKADYTTDPCVLSRITLPPGWKRHSPVLLLSGSPD